jgi:hypothetical protein
MSNLTSNDIKGLMEAYTAVYDEDLREELETEQLEVEELGLQIIENAAYVLFSQGYDVDDLIDYFTEAKTDVIVEDFVSFSEGQTYLSESFIVSDEYIEEQFQQLYERSVGTLGGQLGRLWQFGKNTANAAVKALTPAKTAKITGDVKRTSATVPPGSAKVTTSGNNPKPNSSKGPKITGDVKATSATVPPGSAKVTTSGNNPKLPGPGPKITGDVNKGFLGRSADWAKTQLRKIPGAKGVERFAKSGAGKSLGKVGSRVLPGIGVVSYGADAVDRFKKGDWGGGLISTAGAVTSAIPGVGLVGGLAPTAIQAATDAAGLTGDKSLKKKGTPSSAKPSAALGGQTAFKAGGGKKAMEGGKSAEEIQKQGMKALKARENTPNTAAGFDQAFASARKLGQKEFAWRGNKYTTQMAHTNLFDIVDGELLDETSSTPYDVVLNYLFENGHVDTLEEAHYVMLEMDAETIQSIVEADSLADQQRRREKRQAANIIRNGTPGFDYSKPPSGRRGYLDTLDDEAREKKEKRKK